METIKWTYFQYFKMFNFPVYVRCDLNNFNPDMTKFLLGLQFSEIEEKEVEAVEEVLRTHPHARLLTIQEASPRVARQIDSVIESDRFGAESIVPKPGYKVYRYKETALMVYSTASQNWEMGCFYDFGSQEIENICRAVMTRYLSWALAPLGLVGFWGVPVDEGAVVMRQWEVGSEAIFFDVRKRLFLSIEGNRRVGPRFKILKLDPTLKNRNIRMTSEELLSFLSLHCSFFDFEGLSTPVRQLIQSLTQQVEGMVHPKESFKPRTDLSL